MKQLAFSQISGELARSIYRSCCDYMHVHNRDWQFDSEFISIMETSLSYV